MNPAVFEGHERCHDPHSVVALVKRDHALQPGRTSTVASPSSWTSRSPEATSAPALSDLATTACARAPEVKCRKRRSSPPAPEDGQAVVGRGVVDDDELVFGIGRVLEQALEREIEDAASLSRFGAQEAHGTGRSSRQLPVRVSARRIMARMVFSGVQGIVPAQAFVIDDHRPASESTPPDPPGTPRPLPRGGGSERCAQNYPISLPESSLVYSTSPVL